MTENNGAGSGAVVRFCCQIGHVAGKPTSSCAETPKEMVDGFLLCERHALEVKLEGQIECWGEMLFHIDLWSREARRRQGPGVAGLLQDQRAQVISARHRAYQDLDTLRRSETPMGTSSPEAGSYLGGAFSHFIQDPPGSSLQGSDVFYVGERLLT